MYWRRFAISSIPLGDVKEFEVWLNQRWEEKDRLLEYFNQTGRFPADDAATAEQTKGYINTEVRLVNWYEVGQIFVVLASLGLVVNVITRFFEIILMSLRR
jgi:Acyltransferase C-terminus